MDARALVERFFASDGPLPRLLPGYVPRAPQIKMALACADAFAREGARVVVEAGTGTGKSLAYLAAALASGKKVVVATGTKALQDQLVQKDAPVALAAFARVLEEAGLPPRRIEVALMKGRSNYLCKLRFEKFDVVPQLTPAEARHWDDVRRFAATTTTGDRADVPGLPEPYAPWSEIDAGGETCIGTKCPHYDPCFVTQMRARAATAQLVVVNHHLLCADQRVRMDAAAEERAADEDDDEDGAAKSFGAVIPKPEALVVDEAHALPDVATEYFGIAVGTARVERLLKDVRALADRAKGDARAALLDGAAELEDACDRVFAGLRPLAEASERARLDEARAPEGLSDDARDAGAAGISLGTKLASLSEKDGAEDAGPTFAAEAAALGRRAQTLGTEVDVVFRVARANPKLVVFVEGRKRGMTATAAPIDVGELLGATIFAADAPAVLTSATLAVAGDAGGFAAKIGVDASTTLILPSPFDHARRAALYVPSGMPEPDDPTWTARFDDETKFLLETSQGGALLLFTSHRAMNEAHERLAPAVIAQGHVPLRQGDKPKLALLEDLRRLDDGPGAVLFATQSFWEGVDVRGRALRLVVVDRLPFRVPTDPVQQARAKLCEQQGKSAFFALSLPEAALALKQGAGRLLRSVDDAGVVAILDGRLRTKRYGATFLDTLPPMTRVGSRKTLTEFWRRFVVPAFAAPTATPARLPREATAEPPAPAEAASTTEAPKRKRKKRSRAASPSSRDPA